MAYFPSAAPNDQQHLIAEMLAYGKPLAEIAEHTGVTVEYIRVMKRNALFLTLVEEKREKYVEQLRREAREKLAREAAKSIDTIIELRDGGEDERIRFQAAKEILDQAEVKRNKSITETRKLTVKLSPQQQEMLQAVEVEDGE